MVSDMDEIYNFVYKGLLTDESLDKAGRRKKSYDSDEEHAKLRELLHFDIFNEEDLAKAQRMSVVYTAVHSFENSVRNFVKNAMAEEFDAAWWTKVPSRIQEKVVKRIEDEAKFKWHGARGGTEIDYCDFGDLSAIIVTNWTVFEEVLNDMEWTKALLSILERSRNIVMHGGSLELQDIERIGMNIRDWSRQVGL